MRQLYLIVPHAPLTVEVVDELQSEGIGPTRMRVYAKRPARFSGSGITVTAFPQARDRWMFAAVVGAIAALVVALLILLVAGAGPWSGVFVLIAAIGGAAVGATSRRDRSLEDELQPLRARVRRGDAVIVADVPDARLGEIEREIKARHPEVRVQGTDPRGSPPFP